MKFPTKIIQTYNHPFKISKLGLAAIFISARCKSRKQLNSKKDEDLRIEIDSKSFREIPSEKNIQLFNIPASWNGTKLKGLKKTIIFLTVLNKGEHIINLIPREDAGAFVENIEVKELPDTKNPTFNPEEQAEDGDRRPWHTFVLVDLPLKTITAKVTTKYRWWDSDDVKLIIDGKTQINKLSAFHRYWVWAGSLIKKILKKETREYAFEANPDQGRQGTHYIEFWADKTPVLHRVELNLGEVSFYPEAKVVWQEVNLREKRDSKSKSLAVLRRSEKVEILEKAAEGERTKDGLSNIWHQVKYKELEGYIYSEALEVEGEDKKTIQNFIIQKSQEFEEDENLILAIAQQESDFHPYRISEVKDLYRRGKGIMQITDQTRDEMKRNKKINFNLADPFDFKQNIEGGIRYFKFIRSLYKKNKPDYLEKLLVAWNRGPYFIPENERDNPLDHMVLPDETKIFIEKVKEFYDEDKNKFRKGFGKIFILVTSLGLVVALGSLIIYKLLTPSLKEANIKDLPKGEIIMVEENNETGERSYKLIDDLDNDGMLEEINLRDYYNEQGVPYTEMKLQGQTLQLGGSAPGGYTRDIDKDDIKEVIIGLSVGVNGVWTETYALKNGKLDNIPVFNESGHRFSGFLGRGIKFIDYDDDGDLEIESFWRVYDACDPRSDIYEYIDGSFIFKKAVVYTEEEKNACKKAMEEFKG